MALDETTRQVNRRAVRALEDAQRRLGFAAQELDWGIQPMEHLSLYTNAHDPALEELQALATRMGEVRGDISRRLTAESEGE